MTEPYESVPQWRFCGCEDCKRCRRLTEALERGIEGLPPVQSLEERVDALERRIQATAGHASARRYELLVRIRALENGQNEKRAEETLIREGIH